jgi:hypothetical protein
MEALFPLNTHTDMPFLQHVHLDGGYDFKSEVHDFRATRIGTIHSPCLQSFYPLDPTFFIRPFASSFRFLRKLYIQQGSDLPEESIFSDVSWTRHYFVDLLDSCVQLEVCEVRFQRGRINLDPRRKISLPMLRILHLCFDERFDPVPLLQRLYTPVLQQLSLKNVGANRSIFPLDSFPTITASNLQQLSLFGVPFDAMILQQLLSSLTNLRGLTLQRIHLSERILEALTPGRDEPPGSWLCPRLQRLDLAYSAFSALFLLPLLDHRGRPNNRAVDPEGDTQFLDEIIVSDLDLQYLNQFNESFKEIHHRHEDLRVTRVIREMAFEWE